MHNIEKRERPNFSFVLPPHLTWTSLSFSSQVFIALNNQWVDFCVRVFFFFETVHAVRIENIVKGTMGIKGSGV